MLAGGLMVLFELRRIVHDIASVAGNYPTAKAGQTRLCASCDLLEQGLVFRLLPFIGQTDANVSVAWRIALTFRRVAG